MLSVWQDAFLGVVLKSVSLREFAGMLVMNAYTASCNWSENPNHIENCVHTAAKLNYGETTYLGWTKIWSIGMDYSMNKYIKQHINLFFLSTNIIYLLFIH